MEPDDFDADSEDVDAFENFVPEADVVDSVSNIMNQQSVPDLLINADILLPQGGQYRWPKYCIIQLMLMAT